MNLTLLEYITIGLLFVVTFGFGFWLSNAGKPYNVILLAIHKLIPVGVFVFLAVTVYRSHQASQLNAVTLAVSTITGLLFIGAIATGGLLSTDNPMPAGVVFMHKLLPHLTVAGTVAALYLLCKL